MRTSELPTRTFRNCFTKLNFWTLQLDGISLETTILRQNPSLIPRGLVPTLLNWLADPLERKLVWERCLPGLSTVVRLPILMCSEDIDLNCYLVVIEASADDDYVYWHRVSADHSASDLLDTTDCVVWANWEPIRFSRANYVHVLERYREYLDGPIDGTVYPPSPGERVEDYEICDRHTS